MDDLGPVAAVEFSRLGATVFVNAVVEPIEQAIGRRSPDVVRQRLCEGAKLQRVRTQGLFGSRLELVIQ
jgi:hypothetical protein